MASLEHYFTRFEEEKIYHVYNRCIDKKPLFRSNDNFSWFLHQYCKYLNPVADTLAYCLLGNHFHLMIRVKSLAHIRAHAPELTTFSKLSILDTRERDIHTIVSHQFQKFFQSYAMAFNKQHGRIGTLFQTPFKRGWVDSDVYFRQLLVYIHLNPQEHGLVTDFRDWKWSSFHEISLSRKSAVVNKELLLDHLGNIDSFHSLHGNLNSQNVSTLYDLQFNTRIHSFI